MIMKRKIAGRRGETVIEQEMTAVEISAFEAGRPPQPDPSKTDQEILNRALAESGSVVRALAELLLARDTAMTEAVANATSLASLKADFPKPVTRQQFVQALKAKMRG